MRAARTAALVAAAGLTNRDVFNSVMEGHIDFMTEQVRYLVHCRKRNPDMDEADMIDKLKHRGVMGRVQRSLIIEKAKERFS